MNGRPRSPSRYRDQSGARSPVPTCCEGPSWSEPSRGSWFRKTRETSRLSSFSPASLPTSERPPSPDGGSDHDRPQGPRAEALELLQRAARRRALLRRLRGAAHLPAVSEDGRRADPATVQPRASGALRTRLAVPTRSRWRGARSPLHQDAERPRQAPRNARGDLPEGTEPASRTLRSFAD